VIGFGLDLSGYTTGGTSLAVVLSKGTEAEALVLRGSALSERRNTDSRLQEIVAAEVRDLNQCFDIGPIAVDIPIDLQGLASPERAEAIWELTQRPIDRALRAMPPLADRIGAPVARFSAIMREGKFGDRLGRDLFETYPSENLRRLRLSYEGPAGAAVSRRVAREEFCQRFSFGADWLRDDDVDAVLCALAAVAPEDNLVAESEFRLGRGQLPTGFRILSRHPFTHISINERNFSTWLSERGTG
jgi:hypothetical protein